MDCCFKNNVATYLLEQGRNFIYTQELLGHNGYKTTETYTHVSKKAIDKIKNPIDEFLNMRLMNDKREI